MPEHHTLNIGGVAVEFHIYVDVSGSVGKVNHLGRFLRRMPVEHVRVLYPIFVMNNKPGGRRGGGTWRLSEVHQFLGRSHNTHIPDEEITRIALSRAQGIIGLSRDRWEREPGRIEFTLLHEVGHCVDYSLGLVPARATEANFPGVTTTHCGAGDHMVRRAVEAYSRWICAPSRLYNEIPPGETAASVNRTLQATLRRSPAFASVPADWNPATSGLPEEPAATG
jgi:hypothetical protein